MDVQIGIQMIQKRISHIISFLSSLTFVAENIKKSANVRQHVPLTIEIATELFEGGFASQHLCIFP
jgi:hypothetical protein